MSLSLPIEPFVIVNALQRAGYEVTLVGGAVRDLLSASHSETPLPKAMDFDFTTNATPEQIQTVFPESFYENSFGTVSLTPAAVAELQGWPEPKISPEVEEQTINLNQATKIHTSLQSTLERPARPTPLPNYQITTYRSEGAYSDHRRPDEVQWGTTLAEDLQRRDFTINALALTFSSEVVQERLRSAQPQQVIQLTKTEYTLIDLYHGEADLKAKILRTVGEAHVRFDEDGLRMIRAVRFATQLSLNMTDEVFAAISSHAEHIQHVSWERIRDEFLKMLMAPQPSKAIELLDETGLLHFLLPELLEAKGVEQSGHHTTDVWVHSLDALDACPSADPIVRLATLLHDIAKPRTYRNENGQITFYNHDLLGARIAKQIGQRFRLSKTDVDRLFTLVRYHMFYYQPHNTDAAIRRFMRKVGLENLNDILALREGDRLGSGARKTSWRLEEMKQRMIEQLHQPFAITDLAINGNDLISELQLKPGPVIGKILQHVFERVLDDPSLNTKEQLLIEAKKLVSSAI